MLDYIMFVAQIIFGGSLIYAGITDRIKKVDRKIFKFPRLVYVIAGILILLASPLWPH